MRDITSRQLERVRCQETPELSRFKIVKLSQPPGFPLRFQQGQDVSLPHGPLHISDDLTVALSNELNLHLGTLTLGTGSAQNFDDSCKLDSSLVHDDFEKFSLFEEVNQANISLVAH